MNNLLIDKEKSFKLLNISAYQGYAVAQNNPGILYSDETNGLSKDYVWFSVAFHNGFKEADISRGIIMDRLKYWEIEKAKKLYIQYIKKYPAILNADGTDKECDSGK
ncbi:sel1 repeat family protein [Enterobacter quasimori]|uniref:sel1 repeat family protein n=1 Tax=Enterobacter quasimori TaxID=2838947 RepID=UPI001C0ABB98|nr:sel1 repeat family protein [Enterobacter quasimori]MBT1727502.1 sel1 repeat family protein [Enterobacter quasimori]